MHEVKDIYTEMWEDFQGLAEQLCSFSSMEKLHKAQNLRTLHLRPHVLNENHLCQLVTGIYELFPLLEKLLVEDEWRSPHTELIYSLRAEFVTGDPSAWHTLKYIDNETQSRIVSEYRPIEFGWSPVGFEIKRDPKTGEKRNFIMKMGTEWSGNEYLGGFSK